MSCGFSREMLALHIEGDLADADAATTARHLASCDDCRRFLARGKYIGQRASHQWRRVIEQHDHRAFGGGEIVGREIGMEIGPRQRGCGFRPIAGRRMTQPLKELPNNHG